jgi:hypothetical protein
MPRSCEQSGRLAVVPTPRDAGGTVSLCVATRARCALGVFRALSAAFGVFGVFRALFAAFGVPGATVCCGIAFELDGALLVLLDAALFASFEAAALFELAAAFDDAAFEAGVGVDGVGEGAACGGGADGELEVAGWRTGVLAPGGCGPLCACAPPPCA